LEERRLKEEAMFSTTTAIKNLRNKGMSVSEIAQVFNLTEEEITRVL